MYNIVSDGRARLAINRRTNRNTLGDYSRYRCADEPIGLSGAQLGALPSWLSNAIQGALKGTNVTLTTPAGNKNFDLGDPKQVQQIIAMIESGKGGVPVGVKVSGPGSAAPANTGIFAGANPLLLGAGALLLLKLLF